MFSNQYVVNVLSDFITLAITVLVGLTIYRLTERRRLQAFFALDHKKVIIYLSNLAIELGGALDHRGQRRTYQGDAIPVYEAQFIPLFYQLFNAPVPGLESQPSILKRLRFSDVDVEVLPAPPSAANVERQITFIAIGSVGYNAASREIERAFNPIVRLDPGGFVVLSGNHRVGDSSFAIVQRLRDSSAGQTVFYVAGSSIPGTSAAVRYLVSNWRDLHKRYPKNQPFCEVVESLSTDGRHYRKAFSRP
jgi:hypothetical protein